VELQGSVAVVTGASSGFGELTALRLAREGASVVVAARRLERLESLAERIASRGGRALPVRCDVTSIPDLEALRDRVEGEFGRCDVLVNNAGIPGGGWFEDLSLEQIDRVIGVNLLAVIHCTMVFLPMMLALRRGHIVNLGSLASRYAPPTASVYAASKHGVVAFSEALYYELAPKGILVTSVNPGFAVTEAFTQERLPKMLVMPADRVARTIVDVVKTGRAPEVSVPRALAPWQALRILTPPLYRWGMRTIATRLGSTRIR
jgi:NAD(P)-dependent dehydrogenase (short-subunit alcohol dehydrogenase family)